MACYKDTEHDQMNMVPVSIDQQMFSRILERPAENESDLSAFDTHCENDDNGRCAHDPRSLLKIVILTDSKVITNSRCIEQLCRENITSAPPQEGDRPWELKPVNFSFVRATFDSGLCVSDQISITAAHNRG